VYPADTPLFEAIQRVIWENQPGCEVVPYLTTGYTDAKHLDRLGIVTYGFAPMNNDPGENMAKLAHGHNERIGLNAFRWGVNVLAELVKRVCTAPSSQTAVSSLLDGILEPAFGSVPPPADSAGPTEGGPAAAARVAPGTEPAAPPSDPSAPPPAPVPVALPVAPAAAPPAAAPLPASDRTPKPGSPGSGGQSAG
jgi:hypothetical protein